MKTLFLRLTALIAIVSLSLSCETSQPQQPAPQPPQEEPGEPEQPEEPDEPDTPDFAIEVTNKTELTYTVDITPADDKTTYIFLTKTAEYFDSLGLKTDQEIFNHDMEIFAEEAELFGNELDVHLSFYYITVGDTVEETFYASRPGEEFVVYAYGVEFEKGVPQLTTDVVLVRDTTLEATPVEMPMNIIVEVNGTSVDFVFDALDYTEHYFIFAEPVSRWIESQQPTEEQLRDAAMDVWYTFLESERNNGEELDLILGEYTYRGVVVLSESFEANTQYFVAAVPVTESGLVYAYPTVKLFETSDVAMSTNDIVLSVTDIKPREATIVVITSNDDPYLLGCFTKSNLANMTDEEILDYYLTSFGSDNLIYGDIQFPMTGLEPNTEYLVVAFGCQSGTVTTPLITYTFTTTEEVQSNIEVSINVVGYFDVEEVAAIYSSYADYVDLCETLLLWVVETNKPASVLYRKAYESSSVANVSDETLKKSLMETAPVTNPRTVNLSKYGRSMVLCAVAVDEDGNVSDLYRTEPIAQTYETRGDAWTFINYMHPTQTSKSLVVEE